MMYKMATLPEYKCGWETGEDKMMIVSVGTSYAYRLMEDPAIGGESILQTAKSIPSELMRGIALENDHTCRTIGRCVAGLPIDREVGAMIPDAGTKTNKQFLYARYDIETSQESLDEIGLEDIKNENLLIDNVDACLLYTSPSPRDRTRSRMPSSA